MPQGWGKHTPAFKAKIDLEPVKGRESVTKTGRTVLGNL